jgi:hypothetical protein
LFPFLDRELSLKDPRRIPPCLLIETLKDFDPESLQKKQLKFYCTQLGHSILWEMRKEGALIIIPLFH